MSLAGRIAAKMMLAETKLRDSDTESDDNKSAGARSEFSDDEFRSLDDDDDTGSDDSADTASVGSLLQEVRVTDT